MRDFIARLIVWLCCVAFMPAVQARTPIKRDWQVNGVTRSALLWLPDAKASAQPAPVVFLFHGHGGNATQIASSMNFPELWPEALVVAMEGLPTPGQLTDRSGERTGWQATPGDQGDRDLAFFDAVLATLRKDCAIDARRIYAAGHSNGGGFTYLLWAMRRDVFAAFAPSSAIASPRYLSRLTPAPVFHVAGRSDPLVRFAWQERMIAQLRRLNSCNAAGVAEGECVTRYASATGHPVVTYVHSGGHGYPAEATAAMVAFLRAQARP